MSLLIAIGAAVALATAPTQEYTAPAQDTRRVRTLNDAFHPWQPPTTLAGWQREREAIRRRLLVSNGLWPIPARDSLQPLSTGRVQREGYTVERVAFESLPGHFVTGNVYRPDPAPASAPAVLSPHGHWANGRFYDAGEAEAAKQLAAEAESTEAGARYPLQARMVQLVRMGCVVFHYDMVGYASSRQIGHRQGFTGASDLLHSVNFMGLQTWNSLRAFDYLSELDGVDPLRIGVTGASGGGTQTFVLCALDSRPAAAFPAVMAGTAMQGGCVCENASHLRLGINNIAFTACAAPMPVLLSGADDWTIDIETRGLPELRQVWKLFNRPDLVGAICFPQFGHNYNQRSRELMYGWFREHLQLGDVDIAEREFAPLTRAEMDVWTEQHPAPSREGAVERVREWFLENGRAFRNRRPSSGATSTQSDDELLPPAARVLLDADTPPPDANWSLTDVAHLTPRVELGQLTSDASGAVIRTTVIRPETPGPRAVVWCHGVRGMRELLADDGRPVAAVQRLLDEGITVIAADVWRTGSHLADDEIDPRPAIDGRYAGYTFGYNRPWLVERIRDLAVVVRATRDHLGFADVTLVGAEEGGLWSALTATWFALAGQPGPNRVFADLQDFSFHQLDRTDDPDMLPGALRIGGIETFLRLAKPIPLVLIRPGRLTPSSGTHLRLEVEAEAESQADHLVTLLLR